MHTRKLEARPVAVGFVLAVMLLSARSNAQQSGSWIHGSFLDQPNCPLRGIKSSGSVLLIQNISNIRIVNFGVECLIRQHSKFTVINSFRVEEPQVEPHAYTAVGVGFDATPLNICRADGGVLGISEVEFADGMYWRSRWGK